MATVEFQFPLQGLNKATSAAQKPSLTSGYLNNVRPFDVLEGRARGGQRPGLKKLFNEILGTEAPIVALCEIVVVVT